MKKCEFAVPAIDFLGYRVDAEGIYPLPKKIAAIVNFPRPEKPKQLRCNMKPQEYVSMGDSSTRSMLRPGTGTASNAVILLAAPKMTLPSASLVLSIFTVTRLPLERRQIICWPTQSVARKIFSA